MSATIKIAAAATFVAVIVLLFTSSQPAGAGESGVPGLFEIGSPEDHAEGLEGPKMLGFLVSVGADGAPLSIDRAFRLRGTPPPFRTSLDVCRVYRWELRADDGTVLETGKFLDRLALYAQQGPDDGCVKTVVQNAHTVVIRTPDHPGATHLALEVESYHGDTMEEGR